MPRKKNPTGPDEPATDAPDWSSKSARIRWLVDTRFEGNRSALAEAVGFSHTIINRVVGGQDPGQRLMTAMVKRLGVSSEWLLTGTGQPYAKPVDASQPGLPLVRVPLPGHPMDHQALWEGVAPDPAGPAALPSRYWLALVSSQPILKSGTRGFRPGDRLLMEADRARFPRKQDLDNSLCVIRSPGDGTVRLGAVQCTAASEEDGPERLEVDFFDPDLDPSETVKENVYRHHPDGHVEFVSRTLRRTRAGGRERLVPAWQLDSFGPVPTVELTDVVAVWLGLLHRPAGMCG